MLALALKSRIDWRRAWLRGLLIGGPAVALALLAGGAGDRWLVDVWPAYARWAAAEDAAMNGGLAPWMVLASALLVAPIAEEVFFRGLLLKLLMRRWGVRRGMAAASLAFGSLHLLHPISATLFGIVMACEYLDTETLLVPIALHLVSNGLAALVG
jgi:membrane protease YdiL (CAAX protease family)